MKRLILIFGLFLLFANYGFSNDSLTVVSLENDLEVLSHKYETLEKSTDRILNGLYVTIGFILAAVLGLNIWNLIVYNRKQNNLIKQELFDAKKELEKSLNDKISSIPKNINDAQELRHKHWFREITALKLAELSTQSKYIDFSTSLHEGDAIIKFLRLAKEKHDYLGKFANDYDVKKGLLALKDFLEKDEYIHHTEADELLKELGSKKYEDFENYTEKIIVLLKKK